jgi:hypothetical protein
MKYLSNDNFTLGHLENLEEFSYSYTNIKDGVYLTEIDLSGCPNLKKLNLQSFNGNCITLNKKSQETLESIDITGSKIAYINWIDTEDDNTIYRAMIKDTNCKNVLDFSNCSKLNSIKVQNNKAIEYILLHDKANINEFVVLSCDNLKRITGNIGAISVNQFKNLSNFHFNELVFPLALSFLTRQHRQIQRLQQSEVMRRAHPFLRQNCQLSKQRLLRALPRAQLRPIQVRLGGLR